MCYEVTPQERRAEFILMGVVVAVVAAIIGAMYYFGAF